MDFDARIFRREQSAMTSGTAKDGQWVLQYLPEGKRYTDPLMGWTGITDTANQVEIVFGSQKEAIDFAAERGLKVSVTGSRERKRLVKSYSENFASDRKQPWTH